MVGYASPSPSPSPGPNPNPNANPSQVNDDPSLHDYNVDQWVDKFVQDALEQANHTLSSHQMWACGSDFQFQNADHWHAPPRAVLALTLTRTRTRTLTRQCNLDKP